MQNHKNGFFSGSHSKEISGGTSQSQVLSFYEKINSGDMTKMADGIYQLGSFLAETYPAMVNRYEKLQEYLEGFNGQFSLGEKIIRNIGALKDRIDEFYCNAVDNADLDSFLYASKMKAALNCLPRLIGKDLFEQTLRKGNITNDDKDCKIDKIIVKEKGKKENHYSKAEEALNSMDTYLKRVEKKANEYSENSPRGQYLTKLHSSLKSVSEHYKEHYKTDIAEIKEKLGYGHPPQEIFKFRVDDFKVKLSNQVAQSAREVISEQQHDYSEHGKWRTKITDKVVTGILNAVGILVGKGVVWGQFTSSIIKTETKKLTESALQPKTKLFSR